MTEINIKPIASIKPVTDNYFGTDVVDNYRYMENFNDPTVQQWVKAQADFTIETLSQLPERKAFFDRMVELDSSVSAKVSGVFRLVNGKIFYRKIDIQSETSKLYMRSSLDSPEILLVDPDRFRQETGNTHAINEFNPSGDGKYVIYLVSANGSEDASLYVLDTQTLQNIDVPISRTPESTCWLPDNQSFFYHRLQEMTAGMAEIDKYQNSQTYWHQLGTDLEQDKVILQQGIAPVENLPPYVWPCITHVSSDYAIAVIFNGTQLNIDAYVSTIDSLSQDTPKWIKICDAADEVRSFTAHGADLYLRTSKNAARFKIIKTSLANPDLAAAKTVLAESDSIVKDLFAANNALYAIVTENGIGKLIRITYDGKIQHLNPPSDGAINFLTNDPRADGVIISIKTWTKCESHYEYNPATSLFTDLELQPKGKYDAPEDLVATEVTVKSHDGVMIPLSIIHKQGMKLDGANPCLLMGYGAYGYSFDPFYLQTQSVWYERGGVFAIAHVRGGGENGEEWYRAGFQQTKPNTWKDFIACAEYLIEQKYTSPAKLAGEGASAGGILIGRAITERPDLFAVAIPRVGCLNQVRFETTPNGVNNTPEFGSCETESGFQALYAMDSFLHVRDGVDYPAMLITHGITDPRVEPWQSAKFAARVQAASASGKPVLLRMDYEAGHGIGSTKTQLIQERADMFAFMMWQFGIEDC
ncbi:prolyl oligopeptidase family serine peptidase [Chamaesiphon sp. VAR_48_metabat_403]|uniref:prolyl oligopeptidase family serine peptidase n=1 Tax=Chamaesiphon sp. VAR_48_metabat_403 TaxID=2964700 RepID=UPI00286D73CC|nr:prolyl oligopeptidase family serine peptidase [Chamaesiphon sp. VAR_48_metabat_403]